MEFEPEKGSFSIEGGWTDAWELGWEVEGLRSLVGGTHHGRGRAPLGVCRARGGLGNLARRGQVCLLWLL